MKIRIISSKDEISSLENNEEIVHLAFRPSNKDIFNLIKNCSNLKAIHIPNSYKKTISGSAQIFLEMHDIELIEGDVWGHRKDINDYYEIKPQIIDRINELKIKGKSKEDIMSQMGKETRLSKDLIKFLI